MTSAYASFSLRVFRVLLPLGPTATSERYRRWDEVLGPSATDPDVDLVEAGLRARVDVDGRHPRGTADPETLRTVCEVLRRVRGPETEVVTAWWRGYADLEDDPAGAAPLQGTLGPWPASEYSVRSSSLRRLSGEIEPGVRYPTYAWTQDGGMVWGCPLYSDSVYLSVSPEVAPAVEESGLEAWELVGDRPLRSTGS